MSRRSARAQAGRIRSTLREPGGADLTAFPSFALTPKTALFRIARQGRDPWWFSSSGLGRFDLSPPAGTCYLANDPVGALLEVLGPELEGTTIAPVLLDDRRLHTLRVPFDHRLADVTDRRAISFGVTAEISTITPYARPRTWAAAFHAHAFKGVRHNLRHDPSALADGVALFGGEGTPGWRHGRGRVIGEQLRQRLQRECGVIVAAVPRSDELVFMPSGD